jgi:hypothetical protein
MDGGFLVDQEIGEIVDQDDTDFDDMDDDDEGIPDYDNALPSQMLMDNLGVTKRG